MGAMYDDKTTAAQKPPRATQDLANDAAGYCRTMVYTMMTQADETEDKTIIE